MLEITKHSTGSPQGGDRATPFTPGEMDGEFTERITTVADVVRQFALVPLEPAVRACQALSGNEPIDLAVLGQFKSGKSSLLNSVLGEALLPVGALPLTAVVTRLVVGPDRAVRVTHIDGRIEAVPAERLAEFVTEAGNPGNRRRVAVVDVLTPAMGDLPDVRLVDTPGLGSMFAHNTAATRTWMPNVAAAMVTVSAERPLSDEDLRLVDEARQTAPRVIVVLTKVDLLTDADREQVLDFLQRALRENVAAEITVVPFSVRLQPERWLHQLREHLLLPIARNVSGERQAALRHKLTAVTQSCREYLSVGIQAAQNSDADRQRLHAAVFNEKISLSVIQDELALAQQGAVAALRPAFEKCFLAHQADLTQRMSRSLAAEMSSWQGHLASQTRRMELWMEERLLSELTPLADEALSVANDLAASAENRFRRIVEAFRDRLNRNIHEAMGITVSPLAWEVVPPKLTAIPVDVGQTFMVHWDLLWWLLPMNLVGGTFRRHATRQVAGEVEKNLRRLVSDSSKAVDNAIGNLRTQATTWVEVELNTLDRLLANQPRASTDLIAALQRINAASPPTS